jgi:hypothetical protein
MTVMQTCMFRSNITVSEPPEVVAATPDSKEVDLVTLKRSLARWQELVSCQRCRAVVPTLSELFLQDDTRLCSICCSSWKTENSLFYRMNESNVGVHDVAAVDPGRIVWVLQQLVAAHEQQIQDSDDDCRATVHDMSKCDPTTAQQQWQQQQQQHDHGTNHGCTGSTADSGSKGAEEGRWLPSPSSTTEAKSLLWERTYDSLDPELEFGAEYSSAAAPMGKTGPTFYHYGPDNRTVAYDDGNLRVCLKAHRLLHHRQDDTSHCGAFEFDTTTTDPDSQQESVIRIITTAASKGGGTEDLDQTLRDSTEQMTVSSSTMKHLQTQSSSYVASTIPSYEGGTPTAKSLPQQRRCRRRRKVAVSSTQPHPHPLAVKVPVGKAVL